MTDSPGCRMIAALAALMTVTSTMANDCTDLPGTPYVTGSGLVTRQRAYQYEVLIEDPARVTFPARANLRMLIFIPPGYCASSAPYPVLQFNHGIGEFGTNFDLLFSAGGDIPPKLFATRADFNPEFIVVSMQWDYNRAAYSPFLVDELRAHLATRLNIDQRRWHVTGLSAGTAGTANYAVASRYPLASMSILAHVWQANPTVGLGVEAQWSNALRFTPNAHTINDDDYRRVAAVPSWHASSADQYGALAAQRAFVGNLRRVTPTTDVFAFEQAGGNHDAWSGTYNGTVRDGQGRDFWLWLAVQVAPDNDTMLRDGFE